MREVRLVKNNNHTRACRLFHTYLLQSEWGPPLRPTARHRRATCADSPHFKRPLWPAVNGFVHVAPDEMSEMLKGTRRGVLPAVTIGRQRVTLGRCRRSLLVIVCQMQIALYELLWGSRQVCAAAIDHEGLVRSTPS